MSVTYAQISVGGPAYANINGKNIQFTGDTSVDTALVTDLIDTSLYGTVDEIVKDMIPVAKGIPRYYDTAQLTTMFPWIAQSVGYTQPTGTAVPCSWNSNNGDVITLASAVVGKMPDFSLGVDGPVLGEMEIWGALPYSVGAGTANAYYTKQTGQSYSNPAVPGTAVIGNQEFTAAWGSISGFTSFQAQEKWTVSHELKLTPIQIQSRTVAWKLLSYRAMAKCRPLGPTVAQIDAAIGQAGGMAGGTRLSVITANLVITGSNSMTLTVGNAALKTAGYMFGGKPLRNGELGWVSTLNIGSGGNPSQAALTLA